MSVPQCCVRSLSLPASLALATPQGSREPRVRSSNSATASLRGTRRHGARSVSDHASFLLALARGPLPRSVRFVRQQIVSANPVRPRSDRSQLFLVNTGPRRSRVHALLVCRTPGISCEAVRTAAKRRNARGGTAVRLPGAATSFVCFIPLFDGSALPGFTQDSTMPLRTAAPRTSSIGGGHLR